MQIQIGLMRSGKLLAESSPNQLMEKFQCESLDEVFLNLSIKQEEQQKKESIETVQNDLSDSDTPLDVDLQDSSTLKCDTEFERPPNIKAKIYKALLSKNIFQFVRHPGFVWNGKQELSKL